MRQIIAPKLKQGDGVRVVAPAQSLNQPFMGGEVRTRAKENFEKMGLRLTFGEHVNDIDPIFFSSPVRPRIEDLHRAFEEKSVRAIITVIGGFNSNELLPYIDYELIKSNPKIFCGYSDITALQNAIYAKTGLVTYSGPHWFDFGWDKQVDYIAEYFKKCLMDDKPFEVKPSKEWSVWDYDEGKPQKNDGMYTVKEGEATGTIVGGNLVTFRNLVGTEFMPSLKDAILFVEDDSMQNLLTFNGMLTSLSLLPDFKRVKGIVIGRFQPQSQVSREGIFEMVRINERMNFPVIAGADFGHTTSKITFPIGGTVRIVAEKNKTMLEIVRH